MSFMATMEVAIENPIVEPKELFEPPLVEAATLLPSELLRDTTTDDDDDCVICYQTLYRPAKTECGHSACESCMLHWALMAMDVKLEDQQLPVALSVEALKFKCPTCRTYTSATLDSRRDRLLQSSHPEDYASRLAELGTSDSGPEDEYATRTMVLMTGNSHRKVPPTVSPYTGMTCTHEWTFFIQSSRQDLIEQVDVILHPTFRQDRLVVFHEPPFAATHMGWGYFTIFAGITLKEGWEWVDEERAVDSDAQKGRVSDRLPVEWVLDLGGGGSQKNRLLKIRKVRKEQDGEERQDAEDELDVELAGLAGLMSAAEIAQLREVRMSKRAREQQVR